LAPVDASRSGARSEIKVSATAGRPSFTLMVVRAVAWSLALPLESIPHPLTSSPSAKVPAAPDLVVPFKTLTLYWLLSKAGVGVGVAVGRAVTGVGVGAGLPFKLPIIVSLKNKAPPKRARIKFL